MEPDDWSVPGSLWHAPDTSGAAAVHWFRTNGLSVGDGLPWPTIEPVHRDAVDATVTDANGETWRIRLHRPERNDGWYVRIQEAPCTPDLGDAWIEWFRGQPIHIASR